MKKILYLTLIYLVVVFSSCKREIPISVDDLDLKFVMNGSFMKDSLILVSLSKTVNILYSFDKPLPRITDATLKLYKNDVFVENLTHINNGVYISTVVAEYGYEYKVVYENNNKMIVGKCKIPFAEKFKNIRYIRFDELSHSHLLEIKIDDPSDKKNYYIFEAYTLDSIFDYDTLGNITGGYLYKNPAYVTIQEESILNVYNSVYWYPYISGGIMFSDDLFDGTLFTINFNLSTNNYYYENVPDSVEVYLITHSINEDLYNYLSSYQEYLDAEGGFFVEPVNVFSNIENGIGVFGSTIFTLDSMKVPYIGYIYEDLK